MLGALTIMGITAQDQGSALQVMHLSVPWTGDCAGLNILLALLVLFAWSHRNVAHTAKFWWQLVSVVPIAMLVNVLRVLTLVGYRGLAYPEVESAAFHYFIGFLWLIPMASALLLWGPSKNRISLLELLYFGVVLALISPLISQSVYLITAAGLFLFLLRFHSGQKKPPLAYIVLWLTAIPLLAWTRIDSLWIPIILICPYLFDYHQLRQPFAWGALLVSCPLLIALPYGVWIGSGLLLWLAYEVFFHENSTPAQTPEKSNSDVSISGYWKLLMIPGLLAPFITPLLSTPSSPPLQPPVIYRSIEIPGVGYECRIPGTDDQIRLLWYVSYNNDRHHAVEVCMAYRGIQLTHTAVDGVQQSDAYWINEAFLVDEQIIATHQAYIWATLGFNRPAGVHLIFLGQKDQINAETFKKFTRKAKQDLVDVIQIN